LLRPSSFARLRKFPICFLIATSPTSAATLRDEAAREVRAHCGIKFGDVNFAAAPDPVNGDSGQQFSGSSSTQLQAVFGYPFRLQAVFRRRQPSGRQQQPPVPAAVIAAN